MQSLKIDGIQKFDKSMSDDPVWEGYITLQMARNHKKGGFQTSIHEVEVPGLELETSYMLV